MWLRAAMTDDRLDLDYCRKFYPNHCALPFTLKPGISWPSTNSLVKKATLPLMLALLLTLALYSLY